jgi:hypothetical protein
MVQTCVIIRFESSIHELVFFFTLILEESSLRSAAKPERRTPATMSLGKRRGEGESNWDSTGGYDSKRMMMSGAAGGVPGGYGMQGFSAAAMPYGMMPVKKCMWCGCASPTLPPRWRTPSVSHSNTTLAGRGRGGDGRI